MQPFDFIRGVWQKIRGKARARYEGAFQQWGERSWVLQGIQDARFDIDKATRLELLRKARYFEQNSPLVQKLVAVWEQFTVGPRGLMVVPNSSDEDWNQRAAAWLRDWFSECGSIGETMAEIDKQTARSWFVDGDVFQHLVLMDVVENGQKVKRPRVEMIEAHRIGTPADNTIREGESVVDGVEIDPATGATKGFWHNQSSVDQRFYAGLYNRPASTVPPQLIDANWIVQVGERRRPGQRRFLTMLYAGLNALHDLDDIIKLELTAAKEAAAITNVIKTTTGEEINPEALRKVHLKIQSQDAKSGNTQTKNSRQWFEEILGGRQIFLRPNESIDQFRSDRPSVTTQDFLEYIASCVCASVGISRWLVLPKSLQGTVMRADLDTQAGYFRGKSEVIAAAKRRVCLWALDWAIKFDPRLKNPPKNWDNLTIRPPRSVNVDVGKNSAARLAELQAGCGTFQDFYAEQGEDFREQLLQKAEERAYIRSLSERFKLTPDEIAGIERGITESKPDQLPEKTD
jgi:capsid protein